MGTQTDPPFPPPALHYGSPMTTPIDTDQIHRTALLAIHDGSQPTLQAALLAHAATGLLVCADAATCRDVSGQAALLTAVVTATRAFGNVLVAASALETVIEAGIYAGLTLGSAVARQGARPTNQPVTDDAQARWPVLLIGASTPLPPHLALGATPRCVLRASWSGWIARVCASSSAASDDVGQPCVLAAIASTAIGVSEAFGSLRACPGSDAGYRNVSLNLWHPHGNTGDNGPALAHAPASWWLIGLGHLGQAYAWVISWLSYADPSATEIILQDVDRTTPANHSTGVLTPAGSNGVWKTRLLAQALSDIGFDARIIERRLGTDLRVSDTECHVALIGVDNLATRRLISNAGWLFAVDVGLGSGPQNFASMLLRRFPGAQRSDEVAAWQHDAHLPITVPSTAAFADLKERHDACGVTELAGKAVGASFVGIVAGCLAVAEAVRELHGGQGFDIMALDLLALDSNAAPAKVSANVISSPLRRGAASLRIS